MTTSPHLSSEDKKYICYGREIVSASDGDKHYVSAFRLPELFNVPRNECISINRAGDSHGRKLKGLIMLEPQYNGDYDVTKAPTHP